MQDIQLLDVSGPLEVFAEANVQSGVPAYRLRIVAGASGHIRRSSDVRLVPDHVIGQAIPEAIDMLVVAGSPNAAVVRPDPDVVDWSASAGFRVWLPDMPRYSVSAGPIAAAAICTSRPVAASSRARPSPVVAATIIPSWPTCRRNPPITAGGRSWLPEPGGGESGDSRHPSMVGLKGQKRPESVCDKPCRNGTVYGNRSAMVF
jgi:hypothetical protein